MVQWICISSRIPTFLGCTDLSKCLLRSLHRFKFQMKHSWPLELPLPCFLTCRRPANTGNPKWVLVSVSQRSALFLQNPLIFSTPALPPQQSEHKSKTFQALSSPYVFTVLCFFSWDLHSTRNITGAPFWLEHRARSSVLKEKWLDITKRKPFPIETFQIIWKKKS